MVDVNLLYAWVLGFTIVERLVELVLSKKNARWSFDQGGQEFGRGHYPWMVLMHTSFLVACVAEPIIFGSEIDLFWAWFFTAIVALTQSLRWWVITTLGRQWNTRVIIVPGMQRVTQGPFQFLNHPNYVAVIIELIALPLIHGAWMTAMIFSLLNIWLLRIRIATENQALATLR